MGRIMTNKNANVNALSKAMSTNLKRRGRCRNRGANISGQHRMKSANP
jgi:hypothetical protein